MKHFGEGSIPLCSVCRIHLRNGTTTCMLNIATTDCTVYQTTLNLYDSIKKNCSQDFVLHVFSHGVTDPIRERSSARFIIHECEIDVTPHSAVRHSELLNRMLKQMPLDEPVLICDADIYLVHHFDIVLQSIFGVDHDRFIAARSLHDQSLPHPTLFYGKLKLLINNNVTFSSAMPNGRITAQTETGYELGMIPGWIPLVHQKSDKIQRKAIYQISHDGVIIAYHFRNGRKYSKFTSEFKRWIEYCDAQNEQIKK